MTKDFDFSFQPSIDPRSINDIATCQFIDNFLFASPSKSVGDMLSALLIA